MELKCVKNAIFIIFGNQIIWIRKYYTVQFILNKNMIEPECRMCHKKLDELGGILLSPPSESIGSIDQVSKSHICKQCYEILTDWIMNFTTTDYLE